VGSQHCHAEGHKEMSSILADHAHGAQINFEDFTQYLTYAAMETKHRQSHCLEEGEG
jgi:hypothetical protein